MDQFCFLLSVRQVTCQSGVPVVNEKTYTALTSNDEVLLQNGYVLTLASNINNTVTVTLTGLAMGTTFSLVLVTESTVILDLPIEGGTFRVGIYVEKTLCNICECSC